MFEPNISYGNVILGGFQTFDFLITCNPLGY